jgi:hypothetical protein
MSTDIATLEAIIRRAIDGGYDRDDGETAIAMLPEVFAAEELPKGNFIRGLIFDHAFAKAFWGDGAEFNGITYPIPVWQYYLMNTVVEEDYIKYLKTFL